MDRFMLVTIPLVTVALHWNVALPWFVDASFGDTSVVVGMDAYTWLTLRSINANMKENKNDFTTRQPVGPWLFAIFPLLMT
jgi:hypothetical protein